MIHSLYRLLTTDRKVRISIPVFPVHLVLGRLAGVVSWYDSVGVIISFSFKIKSPQESPVENCHPRLPLYTNFTEKIIIISTSGGESSLTCGVCNQSFLSLDLLQHHSKVHQLEDLSNICKGSPPANWPVLSIFIIPRLWPRSRTWPQSSVRREVFDLFRER